MIKNEDNAKSDKNTNKVVEHFDEVTFSIMEGERENERTVRIVPRGIAKDSRMDICESKPIGGVLLGKEEGEEFETDKIPQNKRVFIKSISKFKQIKSKAS